jgi:hypothetical protein
LGAGEQALIHGSSLQPTHLRCLRVVGADDQLGSTVMAEFGWCFAELGGVVVAALGSG